MQVTREQVKNFLAEKHCSMWADYEVAKPDRMELAIDWFLEQIAGLEKSIEPQSEEYRGWKITFDEFSNKLFSATKQGMKYGFAYPNRDGLYKIIDEYMES